MKTAAEMGARVATGNAGSLNIPRKLTRGDLVKWPGGVWYLKWALGWDKTLEAASMGSDVARGKVASNTNAVLEKRAPDLPRDLATIIQEGISRVILQEIRIRAEKEGKDVVTLMREIGKDSVQWRIKYVMDGTKEKYAKVYDSTRSGQRGKTQDVYHKAAMEAVQRYIQNEFIGGIDQDIQLHKDFEPSTRWISWLTPRK